MLPLFLFLIHTYIHRHTHNVNIQPVCRSSPESDPTGRLTQHSAPPAKPALLIDRSQCKQGEPAVLPIAHLSESPAQTNAESRRRHVNPRMLMLEVAKIQNDKRTSLLAVCRAVIQSLSSAPCSAGTVWAWKQVCLEIKVPTVPCAVLEARGEERSEGEGGGGWGCGLASGEKGCDCSRPSNYCHTLSMGNIKRESLQGTPLPRPARSPPFSVQSDSPGFRGWMEERNLIGWVANGRSLSVAARRLRSRREGSEEMLINSFSGVRRHSWTRVFVAMFTLQQYVP